MRIRGRFVPSRAGAEVDYRIEFIPMMLWALVVSFVVAIPVLIALLWLRYVPASALVLLLVIVVIVLPLNLWFSERQAAWLKDYVIKLLDAAPIRA